MVMRVRPMLNMSRLALALVTPQEQLFQPQLAAMILCDSVRVACPGASNVQLERISFVVSWGHGNLLESWSSVQRPTH